MESENDVHHDVGQFTETLRKEQRPMYRAFVLAIALLLMQTVAFAQTDPVPNVMNFQGRLAKPDGTPVPDANYTLRFSLWDAPTGGTEKWSQTVSNVPVRNGIIAILIGLFVPADFQTDRWLEIKIGSDAPLSPRQRLASVAYAFQVWGIRRG
jgi:hypothetical protein